MGWAEGDWRREFEIIRASVSASLKRIARQSDNPGLREQRLAAEGLLSKLLAGAEEASVRGYRMAALEDSRNPSVTS